RYGAALVRCAVEFGLELLARSAHPGALRAARLRHEAIDDAMKYDPIVETLSHQFLDARHVAGRKVGPHLDDNPAFGGHENHRVFGRHCCSSPSVRSSMNRIAMGRPATAPPMASVNGIGAHLSSVAVIACR